MADVNTVRREPGPPSSLSLNNRPSHANPCRGSQSNGVDALEETLSRLSKKPGVKATIALDRASGTILKTAGHISSLRTSSSQQQQQDPQSTAAATASSLSASTTDIPASSGSAAAAGTGSETQGAEELASMVWAFVKSAGGLVHGLDTEVILQSQGQEMRTVLTARPG